MLTPLHFLFEAPAAGPPWRFPARSVVRVGEAYGPSRCPLAPCWRNSTTRPGWVWKADTSSDELTGHTFFYPLLKRHGDLNASEAASVGPEAAR